MSLEESVPVEPVAEAPREVTHTAPAGGVPQVAVDADQILAITQQLHSGSGVLAVDAERASGYRYSQRAYLLQFARNGAGIALFDPTTTANYGSLQSLVNSLPWILHAATQDLACLREAGFMPISVYDTELAAKLLGRPRVGLGALLEQELDVVLAKEHSAVDWSTRPLPQDWLAYAALDVEFLVDLHEHLLRELEAAARVDWYEQERALLLTFNGPAPREEPWRRVSGLHVLREARRLAVVRALWTARDERARELDVSPGRVLHDSVIVDIARHLPASSRAMQALRPVHSRNVRKDPEYWWAAVARALALPEAELPKRTPSEGSIPPPRAWAQRNPEAAQRWERVRPAVVATAELLGLAAEVLVSPEAIRQLCWNGTVDVEDFLTQQGCRAWQVAQLRAPITAALAE